VALQSACEIYRNCRRMKRYVGSDFHLNGSSVEYLASGLDKDALLYKAKKEKKASFMYKAERKRKQNITVLSSTGVKQPQI
jgi:hypothetical protein